MIKDDNFGDTNQLFVMLCEAESPFRKLQKGAKQRSFYRINNKE